MPESHGRETTRAVAMSDMNRQTEGPLGPWIDKKVARIFNLVRTLGAQESPRVDFLESTVKRISIKA